MRRVLLAAVLALAACGHEDENLSGTKQVAPPGQGVAPSVPPAVNPHGGNPHAGGGAIPLATAAPAPVAWTVPAGWTQSPPSSGMRVAQFDVGNDENGDKVQCIVFGGIGGTDEENVARWVGQMGPGAKDSATVAHSEHGGVKVTKLVAHGSYTDPMRPGEPKPVAEATMLAAIVETPAGKIQVKFVGSKSVVDSAAKAFDEFLASMKAK